jgi:hypothetical protein
MNADKIRFKMLSENSRIYGRGVQIRTGFERGPFRRFGILNLRNLRSLSLHVLSRDLRIKKPRLSGKKRGRFHHPGVSISGQNQVSIGPLKDRERYSWAAASLRV